ncbi:hypothetical protein SEPCBS119000_005820 [Sporothrix epigloea]|uniref:Transcription initiation factor TFIID subunit 8 n=1 Tax=Sporothrix epigloea TaxID=1892477 RepID=A0ABP0DZW1_9PEZI
MANVDPASLDSTLKRPSIDSGAVPKSDSNLVSKGETTGALHENDRNTSIVLAARSPLEDTTMDDAYSSAANDESRPTVNTHEGNDTGTDANDNVLPKSNAGVDTLMGGTESHDQPSLPASLPGVKLRPPQRLKRLREQHEKELEEVVQRPRRPAASSEADQARQGLRRALVLALDHVGFTSATSDAVESFLLMTETYIQSLAEDITRFSLAGRRSQPIPPDFEVALARFNLGTSALRPHLRNPVHSSKLVQRTAPTAAPDELPLNQLYQLHQLLEPRKSDHGNIPLLGHELSGQPEKESKSYIPSSFPAFPSIHTYRNTPIDVDTVTVQGSGLRYDDGTMLVLPSEEVIAEGPDPSMGYAPLLGGTSRSRDPKRIREAAAVEAKQAEEALRGLMRASKVNKLKEVRAAADRNLLHKKRYTLWEAAMRELIAEAKQQQQQRKASQNMDQSPATAAKGATAVVREEIADQSMMVNAEKMFHRKEIPRKARKVQ